MKNETLREILLKYFPGARANDEKKPSHVNDPPVTASPPTAARGASPSWSELVTRKSNDNAKSFARTMGLQKVDAALVNAFIEGQGDIAAAEVTPPFDPNEYLNDNRLWVRVKFLDESLPILREQLELVIADQRRREVDLATLGAMPPIPKPSEALKTTATLALTLSMGIAFEGIFEGWLFPLLAWTLAFGFGWAFGAFLTEASLPTPDADDENKENNHEGN